MKKGWLLTIITILVSIVTIGDVRAISWGSDVNTYHNTIPTGSCEKSTGCWPYIEGHTGTQGIRVSIVDASGNLVSGTRVVDYVNDANHQSFLNNGVGYYYSSSRGNKVKYANSGSPSVSWKKKSTPDEYTVDLIWEAQDFLYYNYPDWGSGTGRTKLSSLFVSNNKVSKTTLRMLFNGGYIDSATYNKVSGLDFNNQLDYASANDILRSYFTQRFGAKYYEAIQTHYVVIEPLTYIIYKNNGYVGTAYEFASDYNIFNVTYKDSSKGKVFSNLLGKIMPQALYVTGNHNGIKIDSADTSLLGKRLSREKIMSSAGFGLGIVWLGDTVLTKTTCEEDIALLKKQLEKGEISQQQYASKLQEIAKANPDKPNCQYKCDTCETCLVQASSDLYDCLRETGQKDLSIVVNAMLEQLSGTTYRFQSYSWNYFSNYKGIVNPYAARNCANQYIDTKNELAMRYPDNIMCNPPKECPEGDCDNKVLICDLDNPLHFAGGLDYNTGPNGENCCQYFIDLYGDDTKSLEDFFKKYPKCDNRPKCDPTVVTPGVCEETGKYSDTTDWQNCIYKRSEYEQSDLGLDTTICKVFCREDFTTQFPGNYITVPAGQHFVWAPIKVSGSMECRTTEIDLDKWKTRWDAENNRLPGEYNDWQIAKKKQESIDAALQVGRPSTSCDCIQNEAGFTCCVSSHYVSRTCRSTSCDKDGKNCTTDHWECGYDVCDAYDRSESNRYTLYTPKSFNYDGSRYQESSWCSNESQPDPRASYYKGIYDSTMHEKNRLETALDQCNKWDVEYNIGTEITLTYDYLGQERDFDLDGTTNVTRQATKYYCKDSADGTCAVNNMYANMTSANYLKSYKCTSDGCHSYNSSNVYTYKMPNNKYIKETIEKTTTYLLDGSVYRYTLKPSGLSVDAGQVPQYNIDHGLYFDIGYGNLPVPYETPSGNYNISLQYNRLGSRGQFDEFVDDSYRVNQTPGGRLYYQCTYNVYNCIQGDNCPPDNVPEEKLLGLNVIYRPIDLNDPFPGLEGDGRKAGDNWQGADNNENGISDLIDEFITNNRDVATNEVYNKEPMFEFVLTPSNIKNIRTYNRSRLSEGNYADFELICKEGRECASTFLRNGDSLGKYFNSADGVCYTYANGSTWDSCRTEG